MDIDLQGLPNDVDAPGGVGLLLCLRLGVPSPKSDLGYGTRSFPDAGGDAFETRSESV